MVTVRSPVNDDDAEAGALTLGPLLAGSDPSDDGAGLVERVLALARIHLGLDVSWFSRIAEDQHIFEYVDGESAATFGLAPGGSGAFEDSYCSRVVAGTLPNIIPDSRADPRTRDLPMPARGTRASVISS